MNYLAHIYLSGDNDDLKIGNFVADSIKGKDYEDYPHGIKNGILLHREIDTFTDSHPIVFKSSHRLFIKYGHYSTVITDVIYDHFLAKNWKDYHHQNLAEYVAGFYQLLENNFEVLPKRVQNFYPYMKAQNWLLSYAQISGLEHILFQMNGRVKNDVKLNESVVELRKYYTDFEQEFTEFFVDLEAFVENKMESLN